MNHLLGSEIKVSKLLNHLKCEKHDALYIIVLQSKLIKLEISPEQIDRTKNSVFYNLSSCYWKSKPNLKTIFFIVKAL